jgi:dethiobiotin synthetase
VTELSRELPASRPTGRGLFITGTDTGVGKTYVACLIARALCAQGLRVGVYKPVASGCRAESSGLISDDAVALWEAAQSSPLAPREELISRSERTTMSSEAARLLDHVCPQRFAAPLAPHVAARAEGRCVDRELLRRGLEYWRRRSDVIVVEGVGGLLTPVSEEDYVADLVQEFGFPLVVVSRNVLGVINQTLQTLHVAATYRGGMPVAGVVLNDGKPMRAADDPSTTSNADELWRRCRMPLLAHLTWDADHFEQTIDWLALSEGRGATGHQGADAPRSPS